jgi:hypothetical protein
VFLTLKSFGLASLLALAVLTLSLGLAPALAAEKPAKPAATAGGGGSQWLDEPADVPYAITGALATGKNTTATLHLDGQGAKVALQVQNGQAQLLALANGKLVPVGAAGKLSHLGTDPHPFTVHRTRWQLTFIAGGQIVCRGYCLSSGAEKVGWDGGSALGDLRIQPLGKIEAYDDFTRLPESGGTWEPARGKWGQKALREDVQAAAMDASKSANPFSYYGETPDANPALSVMGYWFWRDYMMSSAVRGGPDAVMGIVVCYQSLTNYLAVEWHSKIAATDPDVLRLFAMENGKQRMLKEARGGFLPGTWYRLGLGYCDGRLTAFVDGVPRVSAGTEAMGQGQAGVLAAGPMGAYFDDVAVTDWQIFRDDFVSSQPGRWAPRGGDWSTSGGAMHLTCSGEAYAAAGEPEWSNYQADVTLKGSASAAGLMLDADAALPVAVAVRSSGGSSALAILLRGDKAKPWQDLVAVPCSGLSGKPARLSVAVEDGLVVASLGAATAQAYVPSCHGGRLALFGRDAKDLAFGALSVEFIPPIATSHTIKEFTNTDRHFEMVEWASRRHAWTPGSVAVPGAPEGSVAGQWWTKGDYRGHYAVDFPLAGIGSRDFSLTIVLDGDPAWKDAGIAITISGKKDQKALHFAVRAGGKTVAEKDFTSEGAETRIECSRLGEFIAIAVGEQVIFHQRLLPARGEPLAAAKPPNGEAKPK